MSIFEASIPLMPAVFLQWPPGGLMWRVACGVREQKHLEMKLQQSTIPVHLLVDHMNMSYGSRQTVSSV